MDETTGNAAGVPSRLKIHKDDETGQCATFELHGEDHTLGNALRYIIQKNPKVKFCGYSLPHPNERVIRMQIQMYGGQGNSALEALEKGLTDLKELSQHVKETFKAAHTEYQESPTPMSS